MKRVLLALTLLLVTFGLEARSWRDLDEGEHEIYGREREEKLPIRMFFIQQEKWDNHDALHIFWLYAHTDYPRYRSSRLLPFYYNLNSKIDNRSLFLSIPYYSEIDGEDEDRALFWLYYWGNDARSGNRYSLFLPLYYHKADSENNRLLLSPLFFYSRQPGTTPTAERDVALGIPVIPAVIWKSGEEKRDLTLFYLFRHRSLKDSTLSYFLPLYYYDAEKDGSRGFFLSPLYMNDFGKDRRNSTVLWLYYWGRNDTRDKDYSALFPFYYHAKDKEEKTFITPLFYYSRVEMDLLGTKQKSFFFISPVYARDAHNDQADSSLLWLLYWGSGGEKQKHYHGLFPLYYYSARDDGEKFFVTPLFWYSSPPAGAGVEQPSFLLSPVYMRDAGPGYRHAAYLWLYYTGQNSQTQKSYDLLFPLFYSAKHAETERFLLTPLFWYARSGTDEAANKRVSLGIPALPLFYWASAPNESEFNFIYLVRHRRLGNDLTTYALPFYYYSREGNESLASYLIPFIWVSSKGENSTWLILPFFYSAQTGNSAIKLSPLYISLTGEHENFRLFLPLYLNYNTKDYSFHLNLTGISLSEEKLTNFPVSAEISREKILVDWDLGWFYNLFRVSSRDTLRLTTAPAEAPAASLPVPEKLPEQETKAPKAVKKTTTRGVKSATKKPPASSQVNPPLAAEPLPDKARLTHKRERTRADAENFFGLYFLFGVSAYEKADHYRHFRLLPLSWLTWNAQNSQGVQTVIPFYVKYEDEDTRYLVFFPVYGIQQKFHRGAVAQPNAPPECTGEISSWLLIVYWNEYDCDTKVAEQTVLWPIYNRYKSDTFGGFRIFPVFWSKWRHENGAEKASHFSPLHYTTISGENFSTTSWLFYRRRTESYSSWGVWGLLHFDRRHDDREATTYIFPFYSHRRTYVLSALRNKPQEERLHHEALFTFALVFWRYHSSQDDDDFTGHFSPLYIYLGEKERDYFYSWIYYYSDSATGTSHGVPLVFHRRRLKNDAYSNFYLIPFYHSRQKYSETNTEHLTWLFPLFYHRTSASSSAFVMPLFYRYARRAHTAELAAPAGAVITTPGVSEEVGHISPLYYYHSHDDNQSFYSWIFYRTASANEGSFGIPLLLHRTSRQDGSYSNFYVPLFYRSHETFATGGDEGVTLLFPLFYTRNSPYEAKLVTPLFYRHRYLVGVRPEGADQQNVFETSHVSPLYVYTGTDGTSSFYSWLFYRVDSPYRTSYGVPLLFHRKELKDGNYSNFFLMPFYYSREQLGGDAGEENVTLLFPLWYRRANDRAHVRLVLGYYHESSAGYRKDTVPLLFGRTDDQPAEIYSWNALFYTFWYERTKTSKEFRFLYGLGFNYADEPMQFSWHFALVSGYKSYTDGYVRHYVLPLWWHSHAGDDSDLYLPFILARFSNENHGNRVFRAVLLGLLYYQNTDYAAHDQTLGVLLGAIYYHNMYPERKFDSYGSLYGLLWHYETEENYKRFSLLTFIYTRTETEKGTRHRFIGIPLN